MADPNSPPPRGPRPDPMVVWADRTALIKREVEAERAASDAKTAKLRAMRLAKESAELEKPAAPQTRAKPR